MRSEMDIMRMDERQRFHWLQANRATLMIVGVVWLLMIGAEFLNGRVPMFLIAMVPTFAGARLGLYLFYARTRPLRRLHAVAFFILVAVGHFAATIAAATGEFATSGFLGLFPEPGHTAWHAALNVLGFPLLTLLGENNALGRHHYDWMISLNSLIWASIIVLIARAFLQRRERA